MLRVDQIIGARGVTAALVAATLLTMSASARAAAPTAAPQPAVSAPAASAKNADSAKKTLVSPYARAAAQRQRVGQAPVGHAPTMMQGLGKPRKPHAGAAPK
jgi:hypothetical protein